MAFEVKIEDHSNEFWAAFNQATDAAMEAIGHEAASHAKQNLNRDPKRIDTGLLRNSITYAIAGKGAAQHIYKADRRKKDSKGNRTGPMPSPRIYSGVAPADGANEKTVYIGSNVEYAQWVHEGHGLPNGGRVAPNRFLKDAVTKYHDEYQRILRKYLENG